MSGETVVVTAPAPAVITVTPPPAVTVTVSQAGVAGPQGPEGPQSWMDYVAWPSVEEATIASGTVMAHTRQGVTIYRLIPDPYDPATDAFYSGFDGIALSDLITTRG